MSHGLQSLYLFGLNMGDVAFGHTCWTAVHLSLVAWRMMLIQSFNILPTEIVCTRVMSTVTMIAKYTAKGFARDGMWISGCHGFGSSDNVEHRNPRLVRLLVFQH